jgi:hypothetical protein
VLTYLVLPVLAPALGVTGALTPPVLAALHGVSIWTSSRALHRSWTSRRVGLAALSGLLLLVNVISVLGST